MQRCGPCIGDGSWWPPRSCWGTWLARPRQSRCALPYPAATLRSPQRTGRSLLVRARRVHLPVRLRVRLGARGDACDEHIVGRAAHVRGGLLRCKRRRRRHRGERRGCRGCLALCRGGSTPSSAPGGRRRLRGSLALAARGARCLRQRGALLVSATLW